MGKEQLAPSNSPPYAGTPNTRKHPSGGAPALVIPHHPLPAPARCHLFIESASLPRPHRLFRSPSTVQGHLRCIRKGPARRRHDRQLAVCAKLGQRVNLLLARAGTNATPSDGCRD